MPTLRYLAVLALIFVALSVTSADTIISENSMFTGFNIYSPTVIYDNGVYKMWYGGWQTQSDYPHDKIYYRTSTDNVHWSPSITVLTPADIGSNVAHVNDPSVTKHFNTTNGQWQYTMFYTICINTCHQADNQIWSSVSTDGINWKFNQTLLAGSPGPSEPSAVVEAPQLNGGFWKVYYEDRLDQPKIKMVSVDGNRHAVSGSVLVVYTLPPNVGVGVSIANPEVKLVNGTWQLFFNAYLPTEADIYKVESTSNASWPSSYEILIQNVT
jgi:hypothetical protein